VPRALERPERLAAVVARTYESTRDCPGLDGIRSMADVLAGYRAQGEYLAEHWCVVSAAGVDVGALILANHPAVGNWELVYMGVAPEARGRGFGEQIVRFALEAASTAGVERLVLAVDAANEPALQVYRRTGFREWERRIVYARLRSTS
jgi:ribosomal protein S18 acetylase RimI-like enzyme